MPITEIGRIPQPISAEDRVILAACGSLSNAAPCEHLLSRELDWDQIVRTAVHNRVISLLQRAIGQHPEVPSMIRDQLSLHSLRNELLVMRAKKAFESALPALVKVTDVTLLRGLAFAYSIFRNEVYRELGDFDFWIHAPVQKSVSGYLVDHHYVPESIQRSCDPFLVEFHYNLNMNALWCSNTARLDHRAMWAERQTVSIAGCSVGLLSAEDTFLYLCLHNVHKGLVRLYRLTDMLLLLRHSTLDWDKIAGRAEPAGIGRCVWAHGLLLNGLQPGAVPSELIERFKPSWLSRSLRGLLSYSLIMHDPNPALTGPDRSLLKNSHKQLLVRTLLIRSDNAHKILVGPCLRGAYYGYSALCRLPGLEACKQGAQRWLTMNIGT